MQDLEINAKVTIPANDLEVTYARSSGPGGQNVNKVNSKVRLNWRVEGHCPLPDAWRQRVLAAYASRISDDGRLTIVAQEHRDQARNLAEARQRLREMLLACQFAPKRRKATVPTLGSRMRRLEGKKQLAQKKRLRKPPEGKGDR